MNTTTEKITLSNDDAYSLRLITKKQWIKAHVAARMELVTARRAARSAELDPSLAGSSTERDG